MRTVVAAFFFFGIHLVYSSTAMDPAQDSRALALSLAFAICFGWLWISKARPAIERSPLTLAWLGYWLFGGISIFRAHVKVEAWFHFGKLSLAVLGFFFFAQALKRNLLDIRSASFFIALGAGMQLLFAGLQKYAGMRLFGAEFGHLGTLTHANIFSAFLLFSLPFTGYCLAADRGWKRILASATLSLSLILLLILKTRSAWVGFGVMSAVALAVFISQQPVRAAIGDFCRRNRKPILVQSAITLLLLSALWYPDSRDIATHFRKLVQAESSGRIPVWMETLGLIRENPLWGLGLGNWRLNVIFREVVWHSPHNDYLSVLSESGIFALACFLLTGLASLRMAVAALRRGEPETRGKAIVVLLAVSGIATDSFFAFPKDRIELGVLTAFVSALALSLSPGNPVRTLPRSAWVPPFVLALAMAFFSYQRWQGERTLKRVVTDGNLDPDAQLHLLAGIDQRYFAIDAYSNPIEYHIALAHLKRGDPARANPHLVNAARLTPLHPRVLNVLATNYDRLGMADSAIRYYRKAVGIYPEEHNARVNLAVIHFKRGERDKVEQDLRMVDTTRLGDPAKSNFRLLEKLLR